MWNLLATKGRNSVYSPQQSGAAVELETFFSTVGITNGAVLFNASQIIGYAGTDTSLIIARLRRIYNDRKSAQLRALPKTMLEQMQVVMELTDAAIRASLNRLLERLINEKYFTADMMFDETKNLGDVADIKLLTNLARSWTHAMDEKYIVPAIYRETVKQDSPQFPAAVAHNASAVGALYRFQPPTLEVLALVAAVAIDFFRLPVADGKSAVELHMPPAAVHSKLPKKNATAFWIWHEMPSIFRTVKSTSSTSTSMSASAAPTSAPTSFAVRAVTADSPPPRFFSLDRPEVAAAQLVPVQIANQGSCDSASDAQKDDEVSVVRAKPKRKASGGKKITRANAKAAKQHKRSIGESDDNNINN